jgi:KDO2-lipid IV(A) lauroyltransferase
MGTTSSFLRALTQAARFDGLWWRQFAYLGSVYGPDWWKRYSPPAFGALFFVLISRNRRAAIANMQHVLAEPDPWRAAGTALCMFAEFANCLTETMEHFGPRPSPIRLDLPDHDPVVECLREDNGAVIVTGHIGNWDVAAKTLSQYERPINIVMAREMNKTTQEYMRHARERAGVRVIYSDTSVLSSLNMIRALRANEIVAIQLDRMLGPGGARMLPFFGAPAPFPSGPFVLARLARTSVVPVFIPRLGRRHYAIRVGTRVRLKREPRDNQALDSAMLQVVGQFEAIIREFPTQWFQFSPFWPAGTKPALRPSTITQSEGDELRVGS